MYSTLLLFHLSGAALTGLTVLMTFVLIIVRHRQAYAALAITLSMLTGWQLISGASLTLIAIEPPTLFFYCRNVVAYLAVVSIVLMLLSRQMKIVSMVWPRGRVAWPLSFGTMAAVAAGVILYV